MPHEDKPDITDRSDSPNAGEINMYRQLVELIEDWIWEVDAQGVYTFCSPVAKKLLGYEPSEIIGKTPFAFMPPAEAQRVGVIFGEIVANTRPFKELVNINIHKDGHQVILETSASPFFNKDGSLAGYRGVDRDITQRTRIEHALRESEQNYRDLVETAQELIWKCDADGHCVYLNPAWEKTLGYSMDEMLGRTISDFQTPEQAAQDTKIFESHMQNGGIKGYETEFTSKSGNVVNLIFNAMPLKDADGKIIGTRGTASDITRLKLAQSEQLQSRDKLLNTQKLESLGLMAGSIAHDFNNLLMVILGNLEMAKESLPDLSPALSRLEEAMHAAESATALTHQMLMYAGRGTLASDEVNMNEIIEKNASMFRAVIPRNIELRVGVSRDLPTIRADVVQMQQIVMNLVTNAAEAQGEQGGVVQISTGVEHCDYETLQKSVLEEKPSEGDYISVEVSDNGEGMDQETLSHLFDPFYTTKTKGRGLGLSSVLGIIRNHNGALFVSSEVGQGSKFKVLLPITSAPSEVRSTDQISNGGPAADKADLLSKRPINNDLEFQGLRVLLVEDEDMVRNVCQRMLEQLGMVVYTAIDGVNALEVFDQLGRQIDLVVMDLSMPRMDGAETCTMLRELKSALPIILASGYYDDMTGTKCFESQKVSFVQKPFSISNLKNAISDAMTHTE